MIWNLDVNIHAMYLVRLSENDVFLGKISEIRVIGEKEETLFGRCVILLNDSV